MKKLSLSHTPIPFPDEFLASFLLRASYINGYESPEQMLNSAGIPIYKKSYDPLFTNEDKFKQVIERLGLSDDLLNLVIKKTPPTFQNFFWTKTQVIHRKLLDIGLNKFCSSCLEDKGYWKKNWLLTPLTVCLDHHIDLIEKCPECDNPLETSRKSLFECPTCTFDLRKSQKQQSTLEDIQINTWFLDSFPGTNETFNEIFFDIWTALSKYFSNLEILKSQSYILNLCHEYFHNEDKFISTLINMIKNNLDYAHPRIQLLPFLGNKSRFKPILNKILSYFRDYNSPSSKCIRRKFNKKEATHILGVSFAAFHKRLKAGILYHDQLSVSDRTNFPASILEEWLINEKKNINGTYTYHHPPPQNDESNDYFTIPEIMEILNINNRNVRLFLKIPDIPTTKKYLNHYTQYCLSKEFVNSFHKKYIFLSPLAEYLDVSHLTLRAKLASLNIKPIYINKLYPAYYARKDIKHLDKSMIENIVTYKNNSGRKKAGIVDKRKNDAYISLSEAAKLLGISPSQTAQLIQHKWLNVENLEIRPYRIPRRSIDNLIQQKNDPTYVDIEVVLNALDCSYDQLEKNWIMTGYLKLRHIGYWRSFSKTEFDKAMKIHQEYFTASEANDYLGMHRTHMTNLVTQGLIKPKLHGNKFYSVRLFLREDVDKLLEAGYGYKSNQKKS